MGALLPPSDRPLELIDLYHRIVMPDTRGGNELRKDLVREPLVVEGDAVQGDAQVARQPDRQFCLAGARGPDDEVDSELLAVPGRGVRQYRRDAPPLQEEAVPDATDLLQRADDSGLPLGNPVRVRLTESENLHYVFGGLPEPLDE